ELHQAVAAIDLGGRLSHYAASRAATVAGDVVPDRFQAILRNGEGDGCVEIFQAVAAAYQLGLGGVALRRVVDALRHGGAAPGFENRQPVGLRITLEHGDLTRRQVVLILLVVLRGDGELGLITGIGIADEAVGRDGGGIGGQPAGPFRDGAGGVAGLLGADRR